MSNLLEMAWDAFYNVSEKIEGMSSDEKEKIGNKALEYIGDYPLYGATSNITYDEAILIALVIGGQDFVSSFDEESE